MVTCGGGLFGLVAIAWRDDEFVRSWLQRVLPRFCRAEIAGHQGVLADIRTRGHGARRFDDAHQALHRGLADVLASLEPTARVTTPMASRSPICLKHFCCNGIRRVAGLRAAGPAGVPDRDPPQAPHRADPGNAQRRTAPCAATAHDRRVLT
jgi:hypothetical protein